MDERSVAARVTHGSLVRVRPRPGRETDVDDLLEAVLRISEREQHTESSAVLRLDDGAWAVLDLFTSEPDRRRHLAGAARQAIAYRSRDLLDGPGDDELLDIVEIEAPRPGAVRRLTARNDRGDTLVLVLPPEDVTPLPEPATLVLPELDLAARDNSLPA